MSVAAVLHLVFVSMWAGLVLAEAVVELAGDRDEAARAHTARLHFWIDLSVELPLLAGVVATGTILLAATPLTTALLVKIVAGGIAIAANLYCVAVVIVRYLRRESAVQVERLGWRVRASALGIPFGALAAYLGLMRLWP